MTKYYLCVLLIFAFFVKGFSTAQISDQIIIGRDTLYLYSTPLQKYLAENNIKFEPCLMGNARGYYAVWEVKNDSLFLNELFKCTEDYKDVMDDIFKINSPRKSVFASWCSATIWIETGKQVFFQNIGGGYYDQERSLIIKDGKITSVTNYDYRDKIKVFDTDFDVQEYLCTKINWESLPAPEKETKFVLSLSKDSLIVYSKTIDSSSIYFQEAKRIIMEMRPYTIVYSYGKERVIPYSILFRFSKEIRKDCLD